LSLAVAGGARSFHGEGGVQLVGLDLIPALRVAPQIRIAMDLAAEIATVLVPSGVVRVTAISIAPELGYRVGGTVHGDIAAGARIGVARMAGEVLPDTTFVAATITRAWFGPYAAIAGGVSIGHRASVDARLELGVVAASVTARDFGDAVASISGIWTGLRVGVSVEL
jgi:hypothetical protein